MIIRPETGNDLAGIHELVETAFKTAKVSNGKEQDYVLELRRSAGYIPELALVAEEDGRLVGHIMLTGTCIHLDGEDPAGGGELGILLVAPLSVVLDRRGSGIGSALMREGLRLAGGLGHKAATLVGDPGYYHRFGFRTAAEFGLRHTPEIPDQYVMIMEIVPGALRGITARIDF